MSSPVNVTLENTVFLARNCQQCLVVNSTFFLLGPFFPRMGFYMLSSGQVSCPTKKIPWGGKVCWPRPLPIGTLKPGLSR